MFLFPLYAALVWYACYRWRRRFLGYAALLAGVGLVTLLIWLDIALMRWVFDETAGPLIIMLLAAEAAAVLVVGSFLVFLPREQPLLPCRSCGYELDGLEHENPRCPECGLPEAVRRVRKAA